MRSRVNIKAILDDPEKRRLLMARSLQAIRAMDGRDLTLEEAYDVVDRVSKEKKDGNKV